MSVPWEKRTDAAGQHGSELACSWFCFPHLEEIAWLARHEFLFILLVHTFEGKQVKGTGYNILKVSFD